VELQGGLTPTYGDWYVLRPRRDHLERGLVPVAGIGGSRMRRRKARSTLHHPGWPARGGLSNRAGERPCHCYAAGTEPIVRAVDISRRPLCRTDPLLGIGSGAGRVILALTDGQGRTVLSYRGLVHLR